MSDIKTKKRKTWKNPLAVWGAKGGNHEVATPEWKNPHQIWRDTKAFKVPTTKIGRFHYEYKSSNHGEKIWNRPSESSPNFFTMIAWLIFVMKASNGRWWDL